MIIKRVIAALLGLVLLAGCNGSSTKSAATYKNGEIPAGVYIYHQILAAGEAFQALGDYSVAPVEVLKRDVNGEKGSDFVARRAAEMTELYALTEFACEQEGVTIDPIMEQQMNAALAKQWETEGAMMEENGVSLSSMQQIGLNAQKSSLLFEKWYGVGGTREIPSEEMETYYKENFRRVLMLFIPKYDNNNAMLDGDALKEREEMIEKYDARLKKGEKIFDLVVEFDEYMHTLSDVAHTHGEFVESEQESVVEKNSPDYPPDLVTHIFSDGSGIERYEGNGYTLFFERRDLMKDKTHFEMLDLSIRYALRQDDFKKVLTEMKADSGYQLNEAAVKRYRPENIKVAA